MFSTDKVYGDLKYLTRRIASDKILGNKGFNIPQNPKYDRYQRRSASIIYILFDRKTSGGIVKN